MSSSISDSDSRFVRTALIAFLCAAAALLVPYESFVRASERVYGLRRANIVMPRTLSPKIDSFMTDFENGVRYGTYAVGTSRIEWGLRPEIFDAFMGPTYNFGLGGISSITSLEFLRRLQLHPQRIIVSVSPFDFTKVSIAQGNRGVSLSQWSAANPGGDRRQDWRRP